MLKNKKVIRLTEGDLNRIVKSAVNNVLSEASHGYYSAKNRTRKSPTESQGYPWHDWRDAYQEFRDFRDQGGYKENPRLFDKLDKEWVRQLKAECANNSPEGYDRNLYRQKLFAQMDYYDRLEGKIGPKWDEYDKEMGQA